MKRKFEETSLSPMFSPEERPATPYTIFSHVDSVLDFSPLLLPGSGLQYSLINTLDLMFPGGKVGSTSESEEELEVVINEEQEIFSKSLGKALSSEVGPQADMLEKLFTWSSGTVESSNSTYELGEIKLVLAQAILAKPNISDETFALICSAMTSRDLTYAESSAFFSTLVLDQVQRLEQPPSRVLLSGLVATGKKFSKAMKDDLLLPLIVSGIGIHSPLS